MKTAPKLWTFRILAVLLPLIVLALLELTFRLAVLGRENPLHDPFLQSTQAPLFEPTDDNSHFKTRTEKLPVFPPQTFPADKHPDEFRIFCLGGSTVYGRPYSAPTAFPAWLQLNLQLAHPDHRWTVVNCGGVSYGSQRLIPVLEECLTHQPDLIILCTGHNEFLERQIYDQLPAPALGIARAVHNLHTYRALEQLFTSPSPNKTPILPSEVDTILDHPGGLETFHFDSTWRQLVVTTFEENIRRLILTTKQSGTPIILVHPPSNLAGCPPFKSEFTRPLTEPQESHWQNLITGKHFKEALQLDPHHPLTHYLLGQSHLANRDFPNARHHLTLARDNDICPLRIFTPMEQSLHTVSRDSNIPLVNAQAHLANECPASIPGNQILVDHVHPTIKGHQLIAELLLPTVQSTLKITPTQNPLPDRPQHYQTHLDSLPELYFTHGLRRLRAVQAWTEGRVSPP